MTVHVQGRGADAARDAADHRGQHRDHAHLVENASPDFSRAVNGIPPIDTQRAITQVLVSDGETTVIGGIYVSREQASAGPDAGPAPHAAARLAVQDAIDDCDESRELLIFITPRIAK